MGQKLKKTLNDDIKNVLVSYSVTIRPKRGIILGLNSSSEGALLAVTQLRSHPEYIISLEKYGVEQHLQCGILTDKRQDNIRRDLLRCFPNFDVNEKKYAIKVKKHNDWQVLVNYCMKEGRVYDMSLKSAEIYNPSYRELLVKWFHSMYSFEEGNWSYEGRDLFVEGYMDNMDMVTPVGFNEWLSTTPWYDPR